MIELNIKDLLGFLDDAIGAGAEVHIKDCSDPGNVVEHVYNDDSLPFDEICSEEHNYCDDCPHFPECFEDEIDDEPDMWGIPDIDRIIFSDPATIVIWADGTKTVVKCMKGQPFECYAGFCAACMKKMFGSTSRAKAIMNELAVEQAVKPKKSLAGLREKINPVDENIGIDHETIMEAVDEALNG